MIVSIDTMQRAMQTHFAEEKYLLNTINIV